LASKRPKNIFTAIPWIRSTRFPAGRSARNNQNLKTLEKNSMNKRNRLLLSAAAAVLFHLNLVAHPGHDHGEAHNHPPAAAEPPDHSHAPAEAHDHPHPHAEGRDHGHVHTQDRVQVPADLKELWGQINLRADQLKKALEKGDHDKLHEVDENLSALLRVLPEKSPVMAFNNRRRLEGQANNLLQSLERIHGQAEAGNLEAAQRQMQAFSRTLALLARHYPEDISGYKAKEVSFTPRAHSHNHSPEPGRRQEDAGKAAPDPGVGRPHSHH
jgi:hypothetical protein